MNFALSEEQEFLKEAARGTLSRVKTVEAAREAIEGGDVPDLWPAAVEAGWPGLLMSEEAGGAGLGPMEAMLVFEELGRVLAAVPLLGHLPATFLHADPSLAEGERRAAYVPARPPTDIEERWTVDPEVGSLRSPAPTVSAEGVVHGGVAWVPDAPGADFLVVVCDEGKVVVVEAAAENVLIEPVTRYDATRPMGHVRLTGAPGTVLDVTAEKAANAYFLAWTLLAAEALGASDRALEVSIEYAKERFTFGRAIGSYQAVKHQLVEILRLTENARSLMYYAGFSGKHAPQEFPLAAAAFRLAAGKAADHATRTQISVHGGIGATFEHDAPLYFRRAQLSRRLLGGLKDAADRVASETFRAAAA
jgi:alkylation response protein AidB-like acyl-CoA dehydrogenase